MNKKTNKIIMFCAPIPLITMAASAYYFNSNRDVYTYAFTLVSMITFFLMLVYGPFAKFATRFLMSELGDDAVEEYDGRKKKIYESSLIFKLLGIWVTDQN